MEQKAALLMQVFLTIAICLVHGALEQNSFNIPCNNCVENNNSCLPFVLVGNEEFPEIVFDETISPTKVGTQGNNIQLPVATCAASIRKCFLLFNWSFQGTQTTNIIESINGVKSDICDSLPSQLLIRKAMENDTEIGRMNNEDATSSTLKSAVLRSDENGHGLRPLGRMPPSGVSSWAKAVRDAFAGHFITVNDNDGSIALQWCFLNNWWHVSYTKLFNII